jgi:hypothetical protein
MRYVYSEPVITVVTDEEVFEQKALIDLLTSVKEGQHTVYLEYRDEHDAEIVKKLETVRITDVTDTTIDIHAFFKTASARIKGILITNLREMRLIATKQLLAQKYRIKRWHIMDIAEIEAI